MLTLVGIILIAAGIYGIIAKRTNLSVSKHNALQDQEEQKYNRDYRSKWFAIPRPLAFLFTGIFTIMLNGAFFWANAGTAYAVQYPWGGDKMVKTQGFKAKWWGRTIPLSYEISIKDIIARKDAEGKVEELPESTDGIYNRTAHRWEFSDAIKADIATAVVVGVEVDDEAVFLNMADRNRSESKLIFGRVLPNIDAALKNTCKLMDAQEYISGKASDFDRYFRDQLENGMYLVEEYTAQDDTPEIIGDTSTVRRISVNMPQANKQTKYRIKRDDQGDIVRDNKSNTLSQYGIKIYQAQVTGIDWESSFDKRLDLQKDEVAKTQLEKQEAERQFYTAKKEIAAGEANKARERASLEKEQIKLTIAAETEAKVAEQNLIAEKKKYEVAKYEALSQKVKADAESYQNEKLVRAGLTPQEKAEWEYKTAIGVAQQLKDLKLPETYIEGGGKSGGSQGTLLETLIGADIAKSMRSKNKN